MRHVEQLTAAYDKVPGIQLFVTVLRYECEHLPSREVGHANANAKKCCDSPTASSLEILDSYAA